MWPWRATATAVYGATETVYLGSMFSETCSNLSKESQVVQHTIPQVIFQLGLPREGCFLCLSTKSYTPVLAFQEPL